jgi:hypothetical protein
MAQRFAIAELHGEFIQGAARVPAAGLPALRRWTT